MKKILIALSGGVDSSVAALLLKRSGYECVGATMRLFPEFPGNDSPFCSVVQETEDARRVAEAVGIPFSVLNLSEEFRRNVIDDFVAAYEAGLTPNPCVICNKTMKFSALYDAGIPMGCDGIATGHYARVTRETNGRYLLRRAADETKDQSYVLWTLTQEQLSRTLFPLGDLSKSEVRKIAEENGFCNAQKRDSQDICFIPDGDYAAFLERYTRKTSPDGDFLDRDGKVIGRHHGSIRYTIGQRKGLGIALGAPAYVCAKDAERNTVTLGSDDDLFSRDLSAHGCNLIAAERLDSPIRVLAKIRYRAPAAPATVEQTGIDTLRVRFDEAQRAITPGQSLVLYDNDLVIGGGIID